MKLLCKFGLHKWGEVHGPANLSLHGPHILFSSWSTQSAFQTCKRCGKERAMERSGWVGMGGDRFDKWRPK
jgi:hypothetical protein